MGFGDEIAAGQGSAAPTATTGPATDVKLHGATLTGVVNPGGAETTYRFRYGPTKKYRHVTPLQSAGAGTEDVPVTAHVSGLKFGHSYHYRLIADNAQGHAAGRDRQFRTHDARLAGEYRVHLRVVHGGPAFGQHPGIRVGRSYRLRPLHCGEALCRGALLKRAGKRGSFRSTLHRSGPATYSGRDRFRGWCDDGLRFGSVSRVHLRGLHAPVRRATRVRGALRVRAHGCISGAELAKLHGAAR